MRRKPSSIIALVLVLLLVGCGSDQSSEGESWDAFRIPTTDKPPLRYQNELHPKPSGLVGAEPKPIMPTDPPPGFLAEAPLMLGIGNVASAGDRLTVQYVCYDYAGKKFGSSWEEGHPFTFTLGKGEAIQGWEEALEAAEPGDRTELVVPPGLTRGPFPRNLPKDATLVFVLELLRVESPGEIQAMPAAQPPASADFHGLLDFS
jgi:hypothetical protein